ncbi:hypothetical protein Tco_0133645 [Tanacetum coccineum]
MSNTNNNLQTQTSNSLDNAIMEASGKDHPPMLAPEGSSKTTTEGYMENYNNVSQDIRDQLNAEAKAVQIILTGIDNDIYSTVDACLNACEMWKAIERLKQVYHPNHYTQNSSTRSQRAATKNIGKIIVNSPPLTYDQEPTMAAEDDEMSKKKEIDKLMALISLSFKKNYKPTNNNLRTSSNASRAHQDNTPKIIKGIGNMGMYQGNLNAEQADWKDDTDDEPDDQELEAHYMYMAQIQEVTPDAADNSRPIFDTEPLHKVQNDNDNYNVFANDKEHSEQPESVNDTYLEEQGDINITIDSLDMNTNGETIDQDDNDLAREREFFLL